MIFTTYFYENKSIIKGSGDTLWYIKSINDFTVRLVPKREDANYNNYIEMFKLNSRYKMHKPDVLKLVLQRKRYTDTKIKQLSKLVGCSISIIKKSLFGYEIFESNFSKKPKTKNQKPKTKNQKPKTKNQNATRYS